MPGTRNRKPFRAAANSKLTCTIHGLRWLERHCRNNHRYLWYLCRMSRHLRERIDNALPTDPDLDAFMQSRFKDVYRRLARGMDRVQKINLLLDLHSELQVSEHLNEWTAPLSQSNGKAQALRTTSTHSNSWQHIRTVGTIGIGICAVLAISAVVLIELEATPPPASGESAGLLPELVARAKTKKGPPTEILVSECPGGAIYDDNGKPVQGAMLILVGTDCIVTSDKTGAFSFDKCSNNIMSALKRPRINIYREGLKIIQNVELYAPPIRTVINIINDRVLRSEALNRCDRSVEVCPGTY